MKIPKSRTVLNGMFFYIYLKNHMILKIYGEKHSVVFFDSTCCCCCCRCCCCCCSSSFFLYLFYFITSKVFRSFLTRVLLPCHLCFVLFFFLITTSFYLVLYLIPFFHLLILLPALTFVLYFCIFPSSNINTLFSTFLLFLFPNLANTSRSKVLLDAADTILTF